MTTTVMLLVIGIAVLAYLIGTSVYVLSPDKMLLIIKMGSYDRVVVPEDDVKPLNEAGEKRLREVLEEIELSENPEEEDLGAALQEVLNNQKLLKKKQLEKGGLKKAIKKMLKKMERQEDIVEVLDDPEAPKEDEKETLKEAIERVLREDGEYTPPTMHTAHLLDVCLEAWPFWRGVYLPSTSTILKYQGTEIWTKNNIEVGFTATITFELATDLQAFVKTFNVLGRGRDLAREEEIGYIFKEDPTTGEKTIRHYKAPCLSQIIVQETDALVQNAFIDVAGELTFNQMTNRDGTASKIFEGKLRHYLAEPRARFARAKILQRVDGVEDDAITGPAVDWDSFDINISRIVPKDEKSRDALSAPERGRLEGEGEGNRIKEIADKSKLEPEEIIRNETLQKIDNVTVVAAPDSLQGSFERLIGKGKK